MIVKKLEIHKLFGNYTFNLEFSNDMTILIGKNGSGKTIILDIISSILDGNFEFLIRYEFEKIILSYSNSGSEEKIIIKQLRKDGDLEVMFKKKKSVLKLQDDYPLALQEKAIKLKNEIRSLFNPIYLPLSRMQFAILDSIEDERNYHRNIRFSNEELRERRIMRRPERLRSVYDRSSVDQSLKMVRDMIKEEYQSILVKINDNNQKMKEELIKISLDSKFSTIREEREEIKVPNKESNKEVFIKEIITKLKDVDKNKSKLILQLNQIGIYDKKESEQIINKQYKVIHELIEKYEKTTKKKNTKSINTFELEIILNLGNINRIIGVSNIMSEATKKNEIVKEPLDKFFRIINNFFEDSNKEIGIDERSQLYFSMKSKQKKVDIQYLSSGEKQTLIFFAYLVFKVSKNEGNIFLADEPETSLHLKWQKEFLKSILDASKNTQIIIATHSPEIVNIFREKTIDLQGYIS